MRAGERRWVGVLAALVSCAVLLTAAGITPGYGASPEPGRTVVVEFYRPSVDHYFYTGNPEEIARLDRGETPGWIRTGEQFHVWEAHSGPTGNSSPMCRFYGLPERGIDSHVYVAPAECADVKRRWPDTWTLETENAFEFVYLWTCDDFPGARYVYRLYNNRADANHRWVVSTMLRDAMTARGWIAEGYGPEAVSGCVLGE